MRSLFFSILMTISALLLSQQPADSISGILRTGQPGQTPYSAVKPAVWNGTLVLDLDFNGWNQVQRQWFLDHGYALGGVARAQNHSAYEIRDYIDGLVNVRQFFIERFATALSFACNR